MGTSKNHPNEEGQKNLIDLINLYINKASPGRPLCLSIFGPPGAGKSYHVKKIIRKFPSKNLTKVYKYNLTQIESPSELSRQLLVLTSSLEDNVIPVIFFDEFDAPMNGTPLGWLSWFLAPMNDGHFMFRDSRIKLEKAIFFFAGGTSYSFEVFSKRQDPLFRSSKGPDFVSRLHGSLDIKGPNNESEDNKVKLLETLVGELGKKQFGKSSNKEIIINNDIKKAFVNAGRFIHGARSIEALLDHWKLENYQITRNGIPAKEILVNHIDRGALNAHEIGGGIGLSGGGDQQQQEAFNGIWKSISLELWKNGATLVYGGHGKKGGLTDHLFENFKLLPYGLLHEKLEGNNPSPYIRWIQTNDIIKNGVISIPNKIKKFISVEPLPSCLQPDFLLNARIEKVADEECKSERLLQSLLLFRLRIHLNRQCVARIIMGGKVEGYGGRMPGILEEAMLALASNQPLYVIGGFGGAAALVGELLGLGKTDKNYKISKSTCCHAIKKLSDLFSDLNLSRLPLTLDETFNFIWLHAINGRDWIDNGLSREENQKLYNSTNSAEISNLIIKGLKKFSEIIRLKA